ncbi:flagellin [uncultured Roseovarius sp.]|uniref:flagellin n=1 Tax=uncultured Roseovarius sp. TaxID=293344 RepID=UPI0026322C8A|nr:flagellin [uncultured Roseovarius sp.]
MNFQTIGDLAQSFALRRQGVELRQQLDRLGQELGTGRVSDPGQHLSGHLLPLADIEHELVVLSGHQTAAREATLDTAVMQAALERVQSDTTDLAAHALSLKATGNVAQLNILVIESEQVLATLVGALNTDAAGRSLFAGAQTDRAPLAPADMLLSELRIALDGVKDRTDLLTRVDAFFEGAAGGFRANIYRGATSEVAPYQLGSGESVALNIRADDPALREALKHVALIALSADETLPLADAERIDLASNAGAGLQEHQNALTALRANLGLAEGRIAQASSRIAAEMTSLEIARSEMVSADAFETAVELEQVQLQLETLYTVTARASRLSLVNFLS